MINAMGRTSGDSVSFHDAAGEIIGLARVEGERIGVTQTPVFLGAVEGGLTFPVFRRGENFEAAFPVVPTHAVSAFADLAASGFPGNAIERWTAQFPGGLNALRKKAINEHGVLAGKSLLVVAPTSGTSSRDYPENALRSATELPWSTSRMNGRASRRLRPATPRSLPTFSIALSPRALHSQTT